jgi:hypothetical protein
MQGDGANRKHQIAKAPVGGSYMQDEKVPREELLGYRKEKVSWKAQGKLVRLSEQGC